MVGVRVEAPGARCECDKQFCLLGTGCLVGEWQEEPAKRKGPPVGCQTKLETGRGQRLARSGGAPRQRDKRPAARAIGRISHLSGSIWRLARSSLAQILGTDLNFGLTQGRGRLSVCWRQWAPHRDKCKNTCCWHAGVIRGAAPLAC